jgi:hypothetical protein
MIAQFYSQGFVITGEGRKYKLWYFMLVDDAPVRRDGFVSNKYGIKVTVTHGGEDEIIEMANITMNISEIQKLLKSLSDNFVTPTTVYDVYSDWIIQERRPFWTNAGETAHLSFGHPLCLIRRRRR